MVETQKIKKASLSILLCSILLLLSSWGMVKKFKETTASSSSAEVSTGDSSGTPSQESTPETTVVYQATSIDFLSWDASVSNFKYGTSGIPQVVGGTLTDCEISFASGASPSTPPQIDRSTCEVSGFRDHMFGACNGLHGPAGGAYYYVTPYIDGKAGKPVLLLLYVTTDDSGPC